MFLKAQLICEDARFELSGTTTLVGVHRERVLGVQLEQSVAFSKLMFVTMVGGLTGIDSVQYRYALKSLETEAASREQPIKHEAHEPTADEHVFYFGNAPMSFATAGRYEISLLVIARGTRATYRYPFHVDAAVTR